MRANHTDEQLRELHKEYCALDFTISAFAKDRNLSKTVLSKHWKKLGLAIRPQTTTKRKFPIDENFFEKIDTEEKAYYLGLMYADGCNREACNVVSISLGKKDEDILIAFSKAILVGNIFLKEYSRGLNQQNRVMLNLVNKKVSQDLAKHGCGTRKTFILQFPNISENLHHHFIRGYFDGDGMLTLNARKSKSYKEAAFSIVSTKEMLETIGKKISDLGVHFGISKRFKNRNNNNYTLRVSGNQQIKKVAEYLYKDSSVFLKRKHTNYLELVSIT